MSIRDVLKDSFIENFASEGISMADVFVTIEVTLAIALYIFLIYRIMTRKGFYNKSFNISLTAVAIITAAIIITIQLSIVVSLGMVGALSIVRFRTAIKDPLDLVFMFWAISVGIICGAGLYSVAIVVSLVITIVIYLLDRIPVVSAASILVVQTVNNDMEKNITDIISGYSKHYTVKSRNMTVSGLNMVIELRVKDGGALLQSICKLEGVDYASLLDHDGDVTF
ncbi:MAG: DUF4956 domain-containing protein [Lachnospiraceae bacterium]|nr:DUF4956 domain-containing protein [Lachnospiraceae bacterium]